MLKANRFIFRDKKSPVNIEQNMFVTCYLHRSRGHQILNQDRYAGNITLDKTVTSSYNEYCRQILQIMSTSTHRLQFPWSLCGSAFHICPGVHLLLIIILKRGDIWFFFLSLNVRTYMPFVTHKYSLLQTSLFYPWLSRCSFIADNNLETW